MKSIGYIRVSTSEQATEGISLANQRAKIQAYCALHDLELVSIIEDAGKSGKSLNRDGIQRVLKLAKSKGINAVVVYKLDRLSRRVLDTLNLIETFEKLNISFHSLNEKIDTGTAMGRFFLNITASLAQMERDMISERTKDALQSKIANGERAGQIPYGYTLAADGRSLIPIERQQEAIKLTRELRAQGYSYRAICQELDQAGYAPAGQKWHPKTVGSILKRTNTGMDCYAPVGG